MQNILLCYRIRETLFYQLNHDKSLPVLHKNSWYTSLMSFEFTIFSMHDIYLGQRSFKYTKKKILIPCIYIKTFHIRNASIILSS